MIELWHFQAQVAKIYTTGVVVATVSIALIQMDKGRLKLIASLIQTEMMGQQKEVTQSFNEELIIQQISTGISVSWNMHSRYLSWNVIFWSFIKHFKNIVLWRFT